MRKIKGYGVGERAVIGRLKRLGGTEASFGQILLCDNALCASEISALPDDVVGVVAVGERTDAATLAVRARGISALFISQEDAEGLAEGERAVIYPERDTLFIAPRLEIVDDLSIRMRAEIDGEPSYQGYDCREVFSGKVGMLAIVADKSLRDEESAFAIYKRAAEECELKKLMILFDAESFEESDKLRANIKGIIRAAVYTKVIVAIASRSIAEYERISQLVKGTVKELLGIGCEIPDGISVGVWINDAREVVCIEEYSRAADLVAVDVASLLGGVCEGEREAVLDGYLRVLMDKMSWRVRDVAIIGEKKMQERIAQGISNADADQKRSYFLMESKNIK